MKHNSFTRLFERYNWNVEQLGDNSYIADNGTFFVAFSIDEIGYASAVSYLFEDKKPFIEAWKKYNRNTAFYPMPIGYYAWHMVANRNNQFMQFGRVCNHDHSTFEIENWLERLQRR